MKRYYVACKDNFLSGWGKAKGKDNIIILTCDSLEEAEIVAENANNRSEISDVKICPLKPHYSSEHYFVNEVEKPEYRRWYEKGGFKKEGN